jgi:hypothetical protein
LSGKLGIFVSSSLKGLLGVRSNKGASLNIPATPVRGLRLQAVQKNSPQGCHLKKNRRIPMNTASKALYADTHPHELISRAQHKLELFNAMLCTDPEGSHVVISHPAISNGIYWLLDGIARELELALAKLMEVKA